MWPDKRGGRISEWCDRDVGRFSIDVCLGRGTNSGGIGGGARFDVKISSPTDRRGEGACRLSGEGLWLRSRVVTEAVRRDDIEKPLPWPRFSDAGTGDELRDSAGVTKGFNGAW